MQKKQNRISFYLGDVTVGDDGDGIVFDVVISSGN
jgi:hypothetical protein